MKKVNTLLELDDYISGLDAAKKEWVTLMVNFMREVFSEFEETFDHKRPTYKGESYFIAFAAQKNYFSFYTDDTSLFTLIKELVPSASMGKGCVRIKYSNEFAIEALILRAFPAPYAHRLFYSPDRFSDLQSIHRSARTYGG